MTPHLSQRVHRPLERSAAPAEAAAAEAEADAATDGFLAAASAESRLALMGPLPKSPPLRAPAARAAAQAAGAPRPLTLAAALLAARAGGGNEATGDEAPSAAALPPQHDCCFGFRFCLGWCFWGGARV
jgi:hypothetical protein